MKFPSFVWIVAALGLMAGCYSVYDQRISTHQAAWNKLSEQERHRLTQGQVRAGDTEEMVLIALGPPDKVLPMTRPDGQKQTLWLYDVLDVLGDPNNLDSSTDFSNREQNIVLQNGRVMEQWATSDRVIPPRILKSRTEATVERMVTRLDAVVNLTPEQKLNAHDIFLKANEGLDLFSPEERGPKGVPIRKKMRADIRAILTVAQQEKYDAAPQYMGGGSTRRR